MSDSDLSDAPNVPADSEIEQCLRRVVRDAAKAGEEISVNGARLRAEEQLGLDSGFWKGEDWKARSKEVITEASEAPSSPDKPKKAAPKPKAKPAAKASTKRKSDEAQPQKRKKQKKSPTSESEDDFEDEEEEVKPKAKPVKASKSVRSKEEVVDSEDENEPEEKSKPKPKPKVVAKLAQEDDDETSALSEPPETDDLYDAAPKTNSNGNGKSTAVEDESEMSEVFDEPPPKKKSRQKTSTSPSNNTKASKPSKPAKTTKELSPDEGEIKRLQGWLLKCGIRKVWGKELKKFDADKQKIKHLKSLLEDVGMTGRYSAEKAAKIKEQRELAAELEAAKEFNDQWGQEKGSGDESSEEDGKEEKARPVRRLKPKGLIDFGDSGDEDSA